MYNECCESWLLFHRFLLLPVTTCFLKKCTSPSPFYPGGLKLSDVVPLLQFHVQTYAAWHVLTDMYDISDGAWILQFISSIMCFCKKIVEKQGTE
jgi:hypothetical protein